MLTAPALLIALTLLSASDPPRDTARQLVLQLTPAARIASDHRLDAPHRVDAALASRLQSLGLAIVRALDQGLPSARAGFESHAASPFGLDPARVLLIEAPDSLAAARARIALALDPAIEWVEENASRAVAMVSLDSVSTPPARVPALPGDPGFPDDPMFIDARQWGLRNAGAPAVMDGV